MAYLADREGGLRIVDVSNPMTPTLAGVLATPDYALGVAVAGQFAYVASRGAGLEIVDVSNPISPTLVATVHTADWVKDVVVVGSQAFVLTSGSLYVVDVADPANPSVSSVLGLSYSMDRLTLNGTYLYAGGGWNGLFSLSLLPDMPNKALTPVMMWQ
jgi:hypothetical protein